MGELLVRYEESGIDERILRAVEEMGFVHMTPIQEKAIPVFLEGRDVIGQAQTGTGKTAAFGIPMLQKIDEEDRSLQGMILCPTRELAMQAAQQLRQFAKYMHNIRVLAVYGGQDINRQIKALKGGVQIIVGTPGRVMDHMRRKTVKFSAVKMVVLDEADEMLDMGFREDIEKILRHTPKQRQTLLFSATMPKEIKRITKFYQKKPKHLKVAQSQMTVPEITQYYFETKEKDKLENLTRLIDVYDVNLGLVFCNTKKRVDWVAKNLRNRGYAAEGIHGDMNQKSRDKVMNKFRNGNIEILIATDVAARGIDVPNVEVVVNYDVPQNPEYYVHRIGRTGRAGNMGYAFTFVAGKEIYSLRTIKKVTKSKIKQRKIPSYKEMESIKNTQLMNSVKNSIEKDNLEKYVKLVEGAMEEDFDSVDIAAALLKMVKEN